MLIQYLPFMVSESSGYLRHYEFNLTDESFTLGILTVCEE